jgi:hypothetical protein
MWDIETMILKRTVQKNINFKNAKRGETVETVRKTHPPRTLGMRESSPG